MHQRLKERLVGAGVLVVLAVIFIPMILTGPVETNTGIEKSNIPPLPDEKFKSKLVPITESLPAAITTVSPIQENTESAVKEISDNELAEKQENVGVNVSSSSNVEEPAELKSLTEAVKETGQDTGKEKKPVGLSAWVVQLGSFSSKENAEKLNTDLRKSGFPAFVEALKQEGKTAYRVRVGPELLRSDADKLLANIKSKMDLKGIVLRYP